MRKFLILPVAMATILIATACGTGAATATPTTSLLPTATPTSEGGATPTEQPGTPTAQPSVTPTEQGPTPTSSGDAAHGQQLVQANGCGACHSINGNPGVGPTWKGLYGSTVTLSDGSTVTADDAYIHESIVNPSAKVVSGFQDNIMPKTFGQVLSDQDIADIIAYIKTLQ